MNRNEKNTEIRGLSLPILDLRGDKFIGDEPTFGDAIFSLCRRLYTRQSVEQKIVIFEVLKKLRIPTDTVSLSESEIEAVKDIALTLASAEYSGRICELLDAGGIIQDEVKRDA